jgi:bifunctional DNA-binding transcriptional regulator/antitoxin component of YhaV-PrlF toxin-antitoxin module
VEHKKSGNEFEALIDGDGKITVPAELREHFAGKKLHVRLNREEVSTELKERDVTEEEIERISSVQLESREQVVKFLLSEGALKRNVAFVKRAKGTKR